MALFIEGDFHEMKDISIAHLLKKMGMPKEIVEEGEKADKEINAFNEGIRRHARRIQGKLEAMSEMEVSAKFSSKGFQIVWRGPEDHELRSFFHMMMLRMQLEQTMNMFRKSGLKNEELKLLLDALKICANNACDEFEKMKGGDGVEKD